MRCWPDLLWRGVVFAFSENHPECELQDTRVPRARDDGGRAKALRLNPCHTRTERCQPLRRSRLTSVRIEYRRGQPPGPHRQRRPSKPVRGSVVRPHGVPGGPAGGLPLRQFGAQHPGRSRPAPPKYVAFTPVQVRRIEGLPVPHGVVQPAQPHQFHSAGEPSGHPQQAAEKVRRQARAYPTSSRKSLIRRVGQASACRLRAPRRTFSAAC